MNGMKESNDKFAKQAKALFDESVDRLDAAALSTLNRSRHRALEAASAQTVNWLRWAPVTGVAVAALVAVLLLQPDPVMVDTMPASVTEMEILLGDESIEMLEDLEFYAWIDQLEAGDDVG
jgi:hypothetical protein